ncbi:hypothetical protein TEU_10945 [Thermococcus eurythermalis]|uniref:Uncharacterized protein n=1 Tax=Thermococcus eurythermalis TaxID=1505907 RepID=A0A097QWI0_9EURY|nr:hypothetical protein [Thermococcus eurythermalis]AIU70806.1 hypothetical protein TEU_10945 [Thermococcus eurythermalis]
MRAKLGYKDKLVEIAGSEVLVFDGKLYTALLEEVVRYYLHGSAVLPPAVREVSNDVVRFLLRTGDLETFVQSRIQYGESLSD